MNLRKNMSGAGPRISRKQRMIRMISVIIAVFLAGTMVLGTVIMFFA